MELLFQLWIISVLVVFVIDYSGAVEEGEKYLSVLLRSKLPVKIPKPFSCSLCTSFWTGLIYLIIIGQLSFLSLFYLVLVAAGTRVTLHLIESFIGFFDRLITLFDFYMKL